MIENMRTITASFIMVMDVISLICMGVVVKKVYKIDRFKNKIILSLILAIILSLLCDFVDWLIVFIKVSTIPDWTEDEWFHLVNSSLDVAAAFFMTVALKLNLRIWVVHYLKIVFMGNINSNRESM